MINMTPKQKKLLDSKSKPSISGGSAGYGSSIFDPLNPIGLTNPANPVSPLCVGNTFSSSSSSSCDSSSSSDSSSCD